MCGAVSRKCGCKSVDDSADRLNVGMNTDDSGDILTGQLRSLRYVGHLENKERLRIQPAQLFNFS